MVPCDSLIHRSDGGGVDDHVWRGKAAVLRSASSSTGERDLIVHKTTWGVVELLEPGGGPHGIRTLVIGGPLASCCVKRTARGAADRGCAVVVDEGCADDDSAARATSLRGLHVTFGRVVRSADDVCDAIEAEAAL